MRCRLTLQVIFALSVAAISLGAFQASEQQPLPLSQQQVRSASETEALEELRKNPKNAAPYVQLGALAIKKGEIDLARSYLLKALELDPRNAEAHEQLGINDAKRQEFASASQEMTTALQINPQNAQYRYNLGALYYNNESYPDAMIQFERALKLQPGNVTYQFALASVLEAGKKLTEAGAEFTRITQAHPTDAEAYNALADALLQQGEIEKASKNVKKAIALRPRYAEAYYLLGKIQAQKGQLSEAARSYSQVIELEPDHLNAHYQLSLLYARMGESAKASQQAAIFRSLKSKVDAANALLLGTNFMKAGKYQLAEQNFSRAIRSDPQNTQALYYLALTNQQERKYASALAAYQKLLLLKPKIAIVQAEMGLLLANMGRDQEARVHLERATEFDQNNFGVSLASGRGFLLLGDYPKAEKSLLRASQLWPSDPIVIVNLFQLYSRWGKTSQASYYAQAAMEADPQDAPLCYQAGLFWAGNRNYAKASEAFRKAATLEPDDAAAYLELAKTYDALGQPAEALDAVTRSLQLKPESGEGHYLRAKLSAADGDFRTALEEAKLAAKFSPDDSQIFLLLSKIYQQLGQADQAAAAGERYRQLIAVSRAKVP